MEEFRCEDCGCELPLEGNVGYSDCVCGSSYFLCRSPLEWVPALEQEQYTVLPPVYAMTGRAVEPMFDIDWIQLTCTPMPINDDTELECFADTELES